MKKNEWVELIVLFIIAALFIPWVVLSMKMSCKLIGCDW